jgi:hypothetical protein
MKARKMTDLYQIEREEVESCGIHWGTTFNVVDAYGVHIEGFIDEGEAKEECAKMNSATGRRSEKTT